MRILTFDIEEWFNILETKANSNYKSWDNFEVRIHRNMDIIFNFLDTYNIKATFFVVGWIAERYPDIIKKIGAMDCEIGSHTYFHQLMYKQSRSQVNEDLNKSISIIENITGKKVKYFRAPGFSLTESNKWVFELLNLNGITHDCSIFPSVRAHGGFPSFKSSLPSLIDVNGIKIKEFPINLYNLFGKELVFSGGGYFRLLPYNFIKRFTKNSDYIMSYFHPRDFDKDQPIISELNYFRRFKSYFGLVNCLSKLEKWTTDFKFIDLRAADQQINWNEVPVIKI